MQWPVPESEVGPQLLEGQKSRTNKNAVANGR